MNNSIEYFPAPICKDCGLLMSAIQWPSTKESHFKCWGCDPDRMAYCCGWNHPKNVNYCPYCGCRLRDDGGKVLRGK